METNILLIVANDGWLFDHLTGSRRNLSKTENTTAESPTEVNTKRMSTQGEIGAVCGPFVGVGCSVGEDNSLGAVD